MPPATEKHGGCRCGALRFRVTPPLLLTMACHCSGCQRMTGGPCSVSTLVASGAFTIVDGDAVAGGLKGPDVDHMFCPACMSWVFTRVMDGALVNVRSVMFDDPSDTAPFVEVFLSEKLPWVVTTAPHVFERFPEPDDYPALMAAYAAQR